jgi:hypothetical protein
MKFSLKLPMGIPTGLPFLFWFFYNGLYWVLFVITLGLISFSPIDAFIQARQNNQLYNIFVIASCYAATAALTVIIYFTRIYMNKIVVRAIPKTWIPVEKGDVNKKVRKMIAASLARSAAVAWDSRPRVDQRTASNGADQTAGNGNASTTEINGSVEAGHPEPTAGADASIILLPEHPVWGEIEHKGWSSPTSKDLPNLQYISVILELPHLIEAKAVSLAPADPQSSLESPVPDLRAVDILQRPAAMGLRDYLTHLITFGVVGSPEVATSFLSSYEYARFSSDALTELEFRNLMKQFAEVLRCMGPLSPAVITSLDIDGESDIDGDASSSTTSSATPATPQNRSVASSLRSVSIHSGSEGTIRTAPSRRPGTNYTAASQNLHAGPEFVTPRSHKTTTSRPSSQNRRLYSSSSSSSSMRSIRSQTSVIKLNRTPTDGSLPYTLHIPRVR